MYLNTTTVCDFWRLTHPIIFTIKLTNINWKIGRISASRSRFAFCFDDITWRVESGLKTSNSILCLHRDIRRAVDVINYRVSDRWYAFHCRRIVLRKSFNRERKDNFVECCLILILQSSELLLKRARLLSIFRTCQIVLWKMASKESLDVSIEHFLLFRINFSFILTK